MAASGWRRSLWTAFGDQFDCPDISDCGILVGGSSSTEEGKRLIHVHKLVLSLHSAILGQLMLTGDGDRQELDLSSTERNADNFTEFLQCLYDNGSSITPQNVEMMLGYSRKYQVRWLQMRCLNFVARNFSEADALYLILAQGF